MSEQGLSKAEAELYDRQIRLWGIESQEKLRAADVLLIGIKGLGSEIAKNILLCGINSLTILDDGIVTKEEINKNFLLRKEDIGKKIAESILLRAQALNPLVKIIIDTNAVSSKSENYFSKFTMVVTTGLTSKEMLKINEACHKNKIKFISGDVFGMFGFSFLDLQEHEFLEEKISLPRKKRTHDGKIQNQSFEKIITKVQRKLSYPKLEDVLSPNVTKISEKAAKRRNALYYLAQALIQFRDQNERNPLYSQKDEDIKKLKEIKDKLLTSHHVNPEKLNDEILELLFDEVPPVCAIVGGIIAQEVIKAISCKEVPINNVFLLDPHTFAGKEETISAAA